MQRRRVRKRERLQTLGESGEKRKKISFSRAGENTIPPPATFITTPSIKHAAGYHWRRREREKWEDKETEGEVDEEELGSVRRRRWEE